MGKYYEISHGHNKLYARVEHYKGYHKLYIGDSKKGIQVVIRDGAYEELPSIELSKTRCFYIRNGLAKPTKRAMAIWKGAFAFIAKMYPHLHQCVYEMRDMSYVLFTDGYELEQSVYSLVYTGCSWYEQYFKAQLAYRSKAYEAQKRKLSMILAATPMEDWAVFAKKYAVPPIHQALLQEMYISSSTLQEFFQKVSEKGRHAGIIYRGWLRNFVMEHVPDGMYVDWHIPTAHLRLPTIEITPMSEEPEDMFVYDSMDSGMSFFTMADL